MKGFCEAGKAVSKDNFPGDGIDGFECDGAADPLGVVFTFAVWEAFGYAVWAIGAAGEREGGDGGFIDFHHLEPPAVFWGYSMISKPERGKRWLVILVRILTAG